MAAQHLSQWLKTLLFVVCLLVGAQAQAQAGSRTCADGLRGNGEKPTTVWVIGNEQPQALLSNASELVRLCSQRPERLLSSPSHVPVYHGVSRLHHLFIHQKTRFCFYRGCAHRLSRPLVDMPQCDYYVYRLRHLLC